MDLDLRLRGGLGGGLRSGGHTHRYEGGRGGPDGAGHGAAECAGSHAGVPSCGRAGRRVRRSARRAGAVTALLLLPAGVVTADGSAQGSGVERATSRVAEKTGVDRPRVARRVHHMNMGSRRGSLVCHARHREPPRQGVRRTSPDFRNAPRHPEHPNAGGRTRPRVSAWPRSGGDRPRSTARDRGRGARRCDGRCPGRGARRSTAMTCHGARGGDAASSEPLRPVRRGLRPVPGRRSSRRTCPVCRTTSPSDLRGGSRSTGWAPSTGISTAAS